MPQPGTIATVGATAGLSSSAGKTAGSLADAAGVLSQYVDALVVRAGDHQTMVELAERCNCAVINGQSDFGHPCQAMADLYTIHELVGRLEGRTLAWIGDASPLARSLALGCGKTGMRLVMAAPERYQFDAKALAWLRFHVPTLDLVVTTDPVEAVCDAVAIYTDIWSGAGDFAPYQVNAELLSQAQRGSVHAQPAGRARRGSDRRSARRSAECGRRAGGQSVARPQGHSHLAARRQGRRLGCAGVKACGTVGWVQQSRRSLIWQAPPCVGRRYFPKKSCSTLGYLKYQSSG